MKKFSNGIKIIFIISVFSKLMSFLSELVIANALGTSNLADIYSMVNGAYIVIYPMISIGIWSCFLPRYKKEYVEHGESKASDFANKVLTFFGVISIIATILFCVFSSSIAKFVAPGFSSENREMLSSLLKIFSPYFVFDTVSTIYAAILQANKKFFGSQIREVICYIPTIIIGPYLFKTFGVSGFVFALLIGVVLRLLIVLPFSKNVFKFHFTIKIFDFEFKSFLKRMPFALTISLLEQINTLVDKIMASSLMTGSISGLNYGLKLTNAFNGFITTPITTAFYPEMAEYVAKNEYDELKNKLYHIIMSIALIIAPFTIIFSLYGTMIVSIVFERGSFDSTSSIITGKIFSFYALGIYFTGIKNIYNKLLYSLDKIKLSTLFCFINVCINIVLNLIFVKLFDGAGLALATSLSSLIMFIAMTFYLRRSINFDLKVLYKTLLIFIINMIILGIPYYLLSSLLDYNLSLVLISITIEFIFIIIVYYVFNIGKFRDFANDIKKRFIK